MGMGEGESKETNQKASTGMRPWNKMKRRI
jgi:hypothetical protein